MDNVKILEIEANMIYFSEQFNNPKLLSQLIRLISEYERLLEEGIPYEEIQELLKIDDLLYGRKMGANSYLDKWWKNTDASLYNTLDLMLLRVMYRMSKVQTYITKEEDGDINFMALELAKILFSQKQKQIEEESLKLVMEDE